MANLTITGAVKPGMDYRFVADRPERIAKAERGGWRRSKVVAEGRDHVLMERKTQAPETFHNPRTAEAIAAAEAAAETPEKETSDG